MSTRAQVRFATREEGVSFSEFPDKTHAQLYKHHDGDPAYLGVDIANSIMDGVVIDGIEIERLDTERSNLDYIYYIWQHVDKSTWISIFKVGLPPCCPTCDQEVKGDKLDECIFVGEPEKLISKYNHYRYEQLDKENDQAVLNAEDPNYPYKLNTITNG